MIKINEKNLSVLLPLLVAKINSMRQTLSDIDSLACNLSDNAIEERVDLQDTIYEYENILDELKTSYDEALASGINLPSFEALTEHLVN